MMIIHRVPTSPKAWMPRNQSSSQKKTITTGSTILSPKYIWLKPIPRRHLLSEPNRVPIRSQSSNRGSLVLGSSVRDHVALGSVRGRFWLTSVRCRWLCSGACLPLWTGGGICSLLRFSVGSSSNSRRWETCRPFTGGVTADIFLLVQWQELLGVNTCWGRDRKSVV